MAVLPLLDRQRVAAGFQRLNTAATSFTKAELQAAVAATDDWIENNQAAYLAALPAGGFKAGSSALQKTILFCYVAMRRAGLFKIAEDG
jgi:hypothetical protein